MLGNKTFDIRTNKGGEVSLKEGGIHEFVAALDFASMYPYVSESFNIDSSAIVPIEIIEELKKMKNNEKIEIIYDLINPSGRGRITLSSGEVIEELFAEFKNDKDSIIDNVKIFNCLVDEYNEEHDIDHKTELIIKINNQRQILKYLYPKQFDKLCLPEKIELIDKNEEAHVNNNILYFPNIHKRLNEIINTFNETNIIKRRWNMIIMLQNLLDREYYEYIIEFINNNLNKTCYKKDVENIKENISKIIIKRDSIYKLIDYCNNIKLKDRKDNDSLNINNIEQEILSLRFNLIRFLSINKIELNENDILPSERISVWTKQSKRGSDRQILSSEHHALKEIYNHFLRAARNNVKKELKSATSYVERLRLNSYQNAIKVLMNSEYGASGASFFPFFNPVIPSMTTASARASIHFLTRLLEQCLIWLDEKFLKDNEKLIKELIDIGIIRHISKVSVNKFFKNYDEQSLKKDSHEQSLKKDSLEQSLKKDSHEDFAEEQSLKNEILNRFNKLNINIQSFEKPQYFNCLDRAKNDNELYLIEILPSKVIYQDTDSNYYIVPHIYEYLMNTDQFDPKGIKKIMHSLVLQNQLYILLVDLMINRPPGSVGFEHAFIVCRHFNAKKKYYGIDYDDSMIDELPSEWFLDENEWKIQPGKSTYCNPNGEFIDVNKRKLLDERVDYFTYAKSQNIKATGMDLARRDQYKFVNLFHLIVIQRDLRIMMFKDNKWIRIKEQKMKDLVQDIIKSFDNIWFNLEKDINCKIEFNIDDFVKTINNNPGKANTNIKELNERYQSCGRLDLKPKDFEKVEVISLNSISATNIQRHWIDKNKDSYVLNNNDIIEFSSKYINELTHIKISFNNIIINNNKLNLYDINENDSNLLVRVLSARVINSYIKYENQLYALELNINQDYCKEQWLKRANDSIKSISLKENKEKNGKRIFRKTEAIEYCRETMTEIPIQNALLSLLDKEYYKKRLLKGLTGYLLEEMKGKELAEINANEDTDDDKTEAIKKLKDKLTLELIKEYRNEIINSRLYSRINQRINKFNMKKYKHIKFNIEHIIYEALHYNIKIEKDNVDTFSSLVDLIDSLKMNFEINYNEELKKYQIMIDNVNNNKYCNEIEFKKLCLKLNSIMNEYEIIINMQSTIDSIEDIEDINYNKLFKDGSVYKSLISSNINFIDCIGKSWLRKPTKAIIMKYKNFLKDNYKDNISNKNIKELENKILNQELEFEINSKLGSIEKDIKKNKEILIAKLIVKDFNELTH